MTIRTLEFDMKGRVELTGEDARRVMDIIMPPERIAELERQFREEDERNAIAWQRIRHLPVGAAINYDLALGNVRMGKSARTDIHRERTRQRYKGFML